MKVLYIIMGMVMMSIVSCSTGISQGGLYTTLEKPDYYYEIDTWGSNSEVYEFTPKSNKKIICVLVMTDSELRPSMQCFKK